MTTVAREYARLRKQGWHASTALDYARTEVEWAMLESLSKWDDGSVRLLIEPDESSTADDITCSHDDADKCNALAIERANRDGVWGIVGQYRDTDPNREGTWITVDSCWGFIGDDWRDSGYDSDIKRATLDAYWAEYKPLARVLTAKGVGL